MKLIKITFLSLIYLTIISCSTTIFNTDIVDAEKDTQEITQFDFKMSMIMAQIWSSIRVFEVSQINSPFDEEALEIKNCISKIGATKLNSIKTKELKDLKNEFQNTNFSIPNTNIDSVITDYIEKLEVFLAYTENKMANTEYSKENQTDSWEKEIKNIHKMEIGTPNRNLSDSITLYRTERNKIIGPTTQILDKYEKVIHDSAMLFHMRNFVSDTIDIADIPDNQNVDYYFWRTNVEKFINNPICSK
tara:strand:- start:1582 stop:2322 length:741 start_codon:yes stop_codon:yes gene_type:complete